MAKWQYHFNFPSEHFLTIQFLVWKTLVSLPVIIRIPSNNIKSSHISSLRTILFFQWLRFYCRQERLLHFKKWFHFIFLFQVRLLNDRNNNKNNIKNVGKRYRYNVEKKGHTHSHSSLQGAFNLIKYLPRNNLRYIPLRQKTKTKTLYVTPCSFTPQYSFYLIWLWIFILLLFCVLNSSDSVVSNGTSFLMFLDLYTVLVFFFFFYFEVIWFHKCWLSIRIQLQTVILRVREKSKAQHTFNFKTPVDKLKAKYSNILHEYLMSNVNGWPHRLCIGTFYRISTLHCV